LLIKISRKSYYFYCSQTYIISDFYGNCLKNNKFFTYKNNQLFLNLNYKSCKWCILRRRYSSGSAPPAKTPSNRNIWLKMSNKWYVLPIYNLCLDTSAYSSYKISIEQTKSSHKHIYMIIIKLGINSWMWSTFKIKI
jgi:hypothetical protein